MTPITNKAGYIISRSIDLWFTGLLSIVAICIVLITGLKHPADIGLPELIIIATVINGAHFLASYRILYSSKEYILSYKKASIYAPIVIFSSALICMYVADTMPALPNILLIFTSLYLSLHYTGQAWGMMATLLFLDGIKISTYQKAFFRISLKCLMCWQLIWAILIIEPQNYLVTKHSDSLLLIQNILILLAIILGIAGYLSFKLIKVRAIIPYCSIYFWYLMLSKSPNFLPFVQFFHAIQYIIFPIRVEINRNSIKTSNKTNWQNNFASYIIILTLLSTGIFVLTPYYLANINSTYVNAFKLLIAGVNIHHFYIDSYIWKLSNPKVKEELFGHMTKIS